MRTLTKRAVRLLGVTSSLWMGGIAQAADRTWDGGGADVFWNNALNWDGNLTAPASGDALFFGGAAGLANSNDLTDAAFSGITFSNGAGAFVLGGNGITLGGDVVNFDADTQTLNLPLLLDATRTFNATSGAITVTGAITGPGGLTKTGTKVLTLGASNSYEGVTTIVTGRVSVTDSSAFGSTNQGTIVNTGGGVDIYNGLTIAEPITLVNQNIPSILVFQTGSNVYSGLITITGGQARIQNQSMYAHITGGITSMNSTVIIDSGSAAGAPAIRIDTKPVVANNQKCFFHGSKTAVLGVAGNTFNDIEVSGGSLLLEVPNAWPTNLTLEVGVSYALNSFIDLQGNDQTIGSLTGVVSSNGVRTVTSSTAPATLTVGQSGSTTFNSNFGGKLRLVKTGSGTLAVTGTNCQQSGQTVIAGGKLGILSEQAFGVNPDTFVADHLALSNGATLLALAPCVLDDANRGITMGPGNGAFETPAATNLVIASPVTGPGGLTKAGAGMLTLTGVNDYSGVTTVSAGILQVGKKVSLYNGSPLSSDKFTVNSGAVLSLSVGGTGEFTSGDVSAIAAQGTATTGFKPGSWLALNADNAAGSAYTVSDTLGNPAGGQGLNLQKLGSGTLELSGMNTYTGATKISQGVLSINSITNGGQPSAMGQAASYRGNLVFDGGTLQYTGPSARTDRGFTYATTTNTYAFDVTQPGTVLTFGSLSNAVVDSAGTTITKAGPGTLVFGKGSGSYYNYAAKAIYVLGGSLLTETGNVIQQNLHCLAAQGPALALGDGALLGYNTPLESYVVGSEMILRYLGTQSCARITSAQLTLCGPTTNSLGVVDYNTHIFDINDGADEVDLDLLSELNIYPTSPLNANSHVRKTGSGTLRLRSSLNAYRGLTTVRSGRITITASVSASGKSAIGQSTSGLLLGDAGSLPGDNPTFVLEGTNNSALTFARGITTFATGGAATLGCISNANCTFSGTITASNTLQLLSVTAGTNALFITGGIGGTGGVTMPGTGTVLFVAANTYTGATTLAAGTLRLAASERIANTSPLRLTGGRLNMNGYSETMGVLDVDGASVIDFGAGSCTLTLADSSGETWGGALLLRNWTSGADHLFVGTSASLSKAQLAKITSPSGQNAAQLPTGEVILLPLGTLMLVK